MDVRFKPWMKRDPIECSVVKETALALLLKPIGEKETWVPKAGIENILEIKSAMESISSISSSIKSADESDGPQRFVMTPWRHQLESYIFVKRMWSAGEGAMLELGMGCGKTRVAIDAMQNTNDCSPVLIVCPKSVVQNWPREFIKHGVPGAFSVCALDKYSVAKRADIAAQHLSKASSYGKISVIVVNYETIWRDDFQPALNGIRTIIMDESQRGKAYNSTVSKFLGKFAPKCKYRLALSGTPMSNSPLDIFAQYRALCPSVFGTRYTVFKAKYAMMGGFQGKVVVGYQNEDDLRRKYLSHALQCDRSVLDLPEAIHIQRYVTLEANTRRIYDQMDKSLVAEVQSGVVTAANAMVKLLRLAQVTGGYVVTEDGDGVHCGTEKQENLEDLMDGLPADEPLVVFCRFHGDMDSVHEAARNQGRASLELSGRRNELAKWQSGGAPVLAVQIQAGGVGIDLTRACHVAYYSVGYSLGDYSQSEARAHRPGQTRPVRFYHLVCENTIDEKIYAALESKRDIVESIIGEMKS